MNPSFELAVEDRIIRKQRELNLMPPSSSHTFRHTGCTRLGENNVNPKVMQYVMGCWMSGGDPFSTDRSGAKNIQMHRSQWMSTIILQRSLMWRTRCLKWTCQKPYLLWYKTEAVVVKCGQIKKIECERECYAMHSSGKNSLAVGLSLYTFPWKRGCKKLP